MIEHRKRTYWRVERLEALEFLEEYRVKSRQFGALVPIGQRALKALSEGRLKINQVSLYTGKMKVNHGGARP